MLGHGCRSQAGAAVLSVAVLISVAVVVVAAPVVAAAAAEPSEVMSQRTEYSRLFANPDGSMTLDLYSRPQQVERPDGSWVPVDSTLRPRPDGTVGPVAAVVDLAFSAGGEGPLARIATEDGELALSWPGRLPEPVLAGPRATYPEVLPGVDLVVTADVDGFSEVLVVKDREAAANPALDRIALGVETTGWELQAEDGGYAVFDREAGEVVFRLPAPAMWDSSQAAVTLNRTLASADGDRVADVGIDYDCPLCRRGEPVTAAELTLTPDQAMLDDPGTRFPVYIDPDVAPGRIEWAMIASAWPDQEYYNWAGDQGMGYCSTGDDPNCVRSGVKRLVWEFGIPAAVHGAQVLGATFRAYETNAFDCTADPVELWQTGAISSATNWRNHSGAWQRELHEVNVARRPGCTNLPGNVELNATAGAASAAAGRWGTLTLGLKAANESSMPGGWKRFRNDATLSITYNSYPGVPSALTTAGKECAGRQVVADATPDLRVTVHDPDVAETDLVAQFVTQRWDGAAWVAAGSAQQGNRKPGDTAQVTVGVTPGTGAPLTHGGVHRWQARTYDGALFSAWSAWCEFEVDSQRPTSPPEVSSEEYRDDGEFHGSPGNSGEFRIASGDPNDPAVAYRIGWEDPPTTLVAAPSPGGTLTLTLTPPPPNPQDPTDSGPLTLYATSIDRAGNESDQARYAFLVGSGTGPAGWWRMDEPAGATSLADSAGSHPAAVSGAVAGGPGRILGGDSTVSFDGADDRAATGGPVIDTSQSYTVAAWVKPDVVGNGWRSVVSATGSSNSAFFLRREAGNRWVFTVVESDAAAGSPHVNVIGTTVSRPGAWVHLAGTYDAATGQARLYVNGVLEATGTVPRSFRASGPVLIAHDRWANNATFHAPWDGAVADVRVWDRLLVPAELAPMAGTLVGRWALDGDGTDWSAYGRDLSPTGAVSWPLDDRAGQSDQVARLDGGAWLSRSGPVLWTNQSFTVAAWVKPSAFGDHPTVVSQCGTSRCAFYVQTFWTNQWRIIVPSADVPSPTYHAATAPEPAVLDAWVHLVGVYDANAGRLSLYVNGELRATVPGVTLWHAPGTFYVGRADTGVPVTGAIDEVQVYAGALPASEITRLYETSP